MKFTWFTHEPMTPKEAEELLKRYIARGIRAERKLAPDPRFFLISALLPTTQYEPKPSRVYQQWFWQ